VGGEPSPSSLLFRGKGKSAYKGVRTAEAANPVLWFERRAALKERLIFHAPPHLPHLAATKTSEQPVIRALQHYATDWAGGGGA